MTRSFASLLLSALLLGAANAESEPVTNRVAPPKPELTSAPSAPKACCYAMTASCLACAEGVSEAEFCAQPTNSHYVGCEQTGRAVPEQFHRGDAGGVAGFGGGLTCPMGLSWAGNGHYCLHNDLYSCSAPGGSPRLVEQCRGSCQHNPPGVPDRCSNSGDIGLPGHGGGYCYSNQQCRYGQICSQGMCVNGGNSGWCTSDYHCGRYQSCRGGQCVSHSGGNHRCYSPRDCRPGDVCMYGQCQPAFPGNPGNGYRCGHNTDCRFGDVCIFGQCQSVLPGAGQCNSCDNSGCGFGQHCVHEGNDYSCNGVCRSNGGGGAHCTTNNECGWGAVCLLGTCRPLWS